jgi:(p)ppGpp synthase/HD superfamily hydrolase
MDEEQSLTGPQYATYEELYEKALAIATEAHNGQTRWNGSPYITHPIRVAARLPVEDSAIAVLHDVLEDTKVTESDLRAVLPAFIVDVVVVLTKRPGELYSEFIRSILHNNRARRVKMADIEDNLSDLPTDRRYMREKYELAHLVLELGDEVLYQKDKLRQIADVLQTEP